MCAICQGLRLHLAPITTPKKRHAPCLKIAWEAKGGMQLLTASSGHCLGKIGQVKARRSSAHPWLTGLGSHASSPGRGSGKIAQAAPDRSRTFNVTVSRRCDIMLLCAMGVVSPRYASECTSSYPHFFSTDLCQLKSWCKRS